MRIYTYLLLATTIAVLVSATAFAQYSISGVVTDADKNPLFGATVYIEGTYTGATTKVNGEFTIKNIPEGKYTITAAYLGFIPVSKEVFVKKNIHSLFFRLEVDAVKMSKDVVVTATRANNKTPIAFQDLDSTYITDNNIGVDLPLILQNATSVVSTSDAGNGVGYSGMRIRGSDATRVNVTINGIPFNDPESQGTFFVNLPDITSSANDIQIQRGVGTSTNGAGAFGASVNINTTELIKEAFGKYTFGYGSFSTFRHSLSFGTGLTKNGFSFDGRLSSITSDGYIGRATSDLKSYYAKAGYYGKKFSAKFITFGGKERTYQAWYGVPKEYLDTNRTFNPYTYPNQVDNYSQTHYQLHLNYAINDQLKVSVSGFHILGEGFYEEYKGTEFNQIIGGNRAKLSDYGLPPQYISSDTITTTNLVRRRWLDNAFSGAIFNIQYTKNSVEAVLGGGINYYTGGHFGEIIWAEYAQNIPKNYRYYNNTGTKTDWNVFAKANYQISDALNAFADMQVRQVLYQVSGIDNDLRQLNVEDNLTFFNPKLGITYEFNNQSSAYASFAVANHEPNRSDYIDAPAGVTPKHETLFDWEVGYRMARGKFAANANLYYMQYKNQLVLTGAINDVGSAIRQNVESSYRRGVELELGYKITKHLTWTLNTTLSQNKIASFVQYVDDWYNGGQVERPLSNTDIAFSPAVVAGSIIEYKRPVFTKSDALGVALISKYVGKQYIDNTQNENLSLDAYFVNDIRVTYVLNELGIKKLLLNFTVRNAFNSLYITNAWSYSFEYADAGWDPSAADPYTQKGSRPGRFYMAGYFPQAGVNYMLGISFAF